MQQLEPHRQLVPQGADFHPDGPHMNRCQDSFLCKDSLLRENFYQQHLYLSSLTSGQAGAAVPVLTRTGSPYLLGYGQVFLKEVEILKDII